MFYATQLAWVPVMITSTFVMFSGDDDTAWELLKGTMWEAVAGQLGYNWLGLMWAQYKRSIAGTTKLTDKDNLIALGINFGWNIISLSLTSALVEGIYKVEEEYAQVYIESVYGDYYGEDYYGEEEEDEEYY